MQYFGGVFNTMDILSSFTMADTAATAATSSAAAGQGSIGELLVMILPFAAVLLVLYFLMIRPQKKKEKKIAQMRDAVQVGDSITTVGGIIGRVVNIKEDGIIIETGADRNKMQIKKWAIQTVDTLHDDAD